MEEYRDSRMLRQTKTLKRKITGQGQELVVEYSDLKSLSTDFQNSILSKLDLRLLTKVKHASGQRTPML